MKNTKQRNLSTQLFKSTTPLKLESGYTFETFTMAYHTYGKMNKDKSNVVWICHALTASSDAADWWSGLVGPGKLIDTDKYYVVCANMLGSSYGSTNPYSTNPATSEPYYDAFPVVSIRDMVHSFRMLADHLDVDNIYCCLGGSTGGMQVVEWGIVDPDRFAHLGIIACDARFSPWGIAFNESQRMAMLADKSLLDKNEKGGFDGLAAARSIAMLSYRHHDAYNQAQHDEQDPIDHFKASSYQRYQGEKLSKRFLPWSYYYLTKAMDTHNVGRGRGSVTKALSAIQAQSTIIGIDRDVLFPYHEQSLLAYHIRNANLHQIESIYGHDAFLIEYDQLIKMLEPIFGNFE